MLHTTKILVLAPHTDDGELGCGATIAKYVTEGKDVIYAAFSTCAQSLPPGSAADLLSQECKASTASLGIQRTLFFDFDVRKFWDYRQQILDQMILLNRKFTPQTVFLPAENDVHQDHQVIYAEGLRAFKTTNILGYELPWNNTRFAPTYFEKLEDQHLAAKQAALKKYHSQMHRAYMQEGFQEALARVRGMQCTAPLAEAFEVYRLSS